MTFTAGKRNLITDVKGLKVGNAADAKTKSGVTVVLPDRPTVAAVQVLGGAPGTRETDLLDAHNTVSEINALVLAGGSAYGLDAASGVQAALREKGVGFKVGDQIVPIVPAAILFDLINGGDKEWGRYPPYRELGHEAVLDASVRFDIGTAGAGYGALTAGLKGGLGSASTVLANGITIGALVAVNAMGAANVADGPHFWASPFEIGDEFGGLGADWPAPASATDVRLKFANRDPVASANTTIAVIATDAEMSKAQAKRMAISAHDGFARALWPAHTPFDGDLVFGLATGKAKIPVPEADSATFHAAVSATTARAIARGIYNASSEDTDLYPSWQARFGAR